MLRFGAASSGQPTAALVAADPDFDLSAAAGRTATSTQETTGQRSRDLQRGLTTVGQLPGTKDEGKRIAAMLGVTPCLEKEALEARINKLKAARDKVVKELKIDAAVLAPRHILTAVAEAGSLDVPAMREWQKRAVGDALLRALR